MRQVCCCCCCAAAGGTRRGWARSRGHRAATRSHAACAEPRPLQPHLAVRLMLLLALPPPSHPPKVIECDIAPQVASRGVGIAPYKVGGWVRAGPGPAYAAALGPPRNPGCVRTASCLPACCLPAFNFSPAGRAHQAVLLSSRPLPTGQACAGQRRRGGGRHLSPGSRAGGAQRQQPARLGCAGVGSRAGAQGAVLQLLTGCRALLCTFAVTRSHDPRHLAQPFLQTSSTSRTRAPMKGGAVGGGRARRPHPQRRRRQQAAGAASARRAARAALSCCFS